LPILNDFSNGHGTPTTIDPVHAEKDEECFPEERIYDVVMGMLMYLAFNTRRDITYAVQQGAEFTHESRRSHAAGIKEILWYLVKRKLMD
jgi:hypothetical protein